MTSTMTSVFKKFNTALVTLTMVGLVGCASTAAREGTGEYVDDTVVTTKVKTAIIADASLKATEINVETFKGVVQLSGFVGDKDAIQRATDVTRRIKGVKEVKNDLHAK